MISVGQRYNFNHRYRFYLFEKYPIDIDLNLFII
jgi:hypothetical protein